jgi:hypothetical protein
MSGPGYFEFHHHIVQHIPPFIYTIYILAQHYYKASTHIHSSKAIIAQEIDPHDWNQYRHAGWRGGNKVDGGQSRSPRTFMSSIIPTRFHKHVPHLPLAKVSQVEGLS